ncbi:VVA0879 family protein [Paenibacillus yanchengensis]|uniref:VVA0879 family protein n=1 Tax=Paenibacillus yanchengensis TaxID=2035833 RepID=A0ABW4YLA1_9BACL
MIKQTLDEWRNEAMERFGEKTSQWKFTCPRCQNSQSPQDFVDAGIAQQEAANMSYQQCIGRKVTGKGCDWVAYGLLGTLGQGRVVVAPDGREVEVFNFAEQQKNSPR